MNELDLVASLVEITKSQQQQIDSLKKEMDELNRVLANVIDREKRAAINHDE